MNAPRSKSVPAFRSNNTATAEDKEDLTTFPELPQEPTSDQRVPSWVQELANARANRHSRASSVISTRTRFSTTTFDDTRSIDIQAGGQTFRIGRFGDRITDTTAPPPYSGPSEENELYCHPALFSTDIATNEHDGLHRRRFRHRPPSIRRQARKVRIAMPDHDDTIAVNDEDSIAIDTPSRQLTEEEIQQMIMDLPIRLKSVLGINPEPLDLDNDATSFAANRSGLEAENEGNNDLDHLVINSNSETFQDGKTDDNIYVRSILRNPPEKTPYHTDAIMLDREETRWTQATKSNLGINRSRQDGHQSSSHLESPSDEENDLPSSSAETLRPRDRPLPNETPLAPTVGDLNELSHVYNKVIRDLDREHRKQLHNRDKELDQLRILLHEKDIVYRQQLKGRDFVIEDLRKRLEHFEETIELRLERARNEVEDLWETRWKEHHKQLVEKCGLMRTQWQNSSEGATQTDD